MSVHAAGGTGDRLDLEVGDWMIHDLKVGFKVGVAYLLEENLKLGLDLLCLVEEIELVFLLLAQDAIDQLLELLWTGCNWDLIDPK